MQKTISRLGWMLCAMGALSSVAHAEAIQSYPQSSAQQLTRIGFGSCARERQEQPVWQEVITHQPELFLMIGDNIYADVWEKDGELQYAPVESAARFDEAYQALAAKPEFQQLAAKTPLMATWDDHDYGANDAGREFPLKAESQKAFMDFFGVASNDPLRKQPGIYHARTFGTEGQRVQVIMLDTRYHREALFRNPAGRPEGLGPYAPHAEDSPSLLGEAQWQWLEQQLREPADVRLLVSSIQVVAYEHAYESWGNFPKERQRLYDLIGKTGANGVVMLSGDRHLMEISRDNGELGAKVPYPMWDFTASGLTQRASEVNDPNAFRVGPVARKTNFGLIDIDWEGKQTRIDLRGLDAQGELITRQSVFLSELQVKD